MPQPKYSKVGREEEEGNDNARKRRGKRRAVMSVGCLVVCASIFSQFDLDLGSYEELLNASMSTSRNVKVVLGEALENLWNGAHSLSPFCETLHKAARIDPGNQRKMAHAFVCNSGHLPLLLNSLASIQRVSPSWPSIVFGLDKDVCPQLKLRAQLAAQTVCVPYAERVLQQMKTDEPESYAEYLRVNKSISQSASWGSEMHKILINSKLYALRETLNCALDAFITDTDIVFMNDPWPYFTTGQNHNHNLTDIIAQCDTNKAQNPLDINSGFMYWKDTPLNRNLSQTLVADMIWWNIDQSRVNNLLLDRKIPVTLLETQKFPNGFVLPSLEKHQLYQTIAIHVNWNDHFDNKTTTLKKHGLWFLDDDP